jgi:hypothetical protein
VNKIDLIVTRSGGTTCSGTVVERYISGTPDSRLAGNSTSQQLGGSGVVSGQSYTDGLYDVCLYTYDVAENKSTMSSTSFELETDTLHIGWTDSTGVRYQTRSGVGNWFGEPETPASGTFGARTSLAVDANGAPWLAYQYDNGTTSFLAYKQRNSGTWGSEVTLASSVSSGKTGLYADIALNNQGLLVSTSYGLKNSVQGMMVADSDGSTSVRDSTSAATPNGVRDTSVTIAGSDNKTYSVASMLNGSNLYELRILNRTAGSVTAIPFPTGCAEAPYASSFAYSDTQIGIAMACRMSSGACTVQYGLATFNTTNNTYSYSTWLNIGTIKASSCVLSDLTEGHRPSLAINRPTSDNGNSTVVGIVWTNSSKQIQYSETILAPIVSTSTPTATTVATGTGTTVGQQTLSFDKFGKAYIVYQDDNSIMFTNNNSGTFRTPALISTASSPPTVTGVGNIGITGMRGRGNTNGR